MCNYEAPRDICRVSLDTEWPTGKNQDRLRAHIIPSLMASPQTASNVCDDEAPHEICCMNLGTRTSAFEPVARIATCILEFQGRLPAHLISSAMASPSFLETMCSSVALHDTCPKNLDIERPTLVILGRPWA